MLCHCCRLLLKVRHKYCLCGLLAINQNIYVFNIVAVVVCGVVVIFCNVVVAFVVCGVAVVICGVFAFWGVSYFVDLVSSVAIVVFIDFIVVFCAFFVGVIKIDIVFLLEVACKAAFSTCGLMHASAWVPFTFYNTFFDNTVSFTVRTIFFIVDVVVAFVITVVVIVAVFAVVVQIQIFDKIF